ncbi:hypothetical protein NIES30_23130 [Phormidium tenue NIES-30]|uniref:Uncharacterized protein n=2 Tax=Phormidium tenue TaxID=126344 RepID=A0A1U7IZ73_9CYAN|nr:hypothetical protein NIES30_23130 [Phormidium tenue NIES-30]
MAKGADDKDFFLPTHLQSPMTLTNKLELAQENPPTSEKQTIAAIIKLSQDLLNKTADPVQRQQHPKSHGCVKAEFIVKDVPEHLKFGVFTEPCT